MTGDSSAVSVDLSLMQAAMTWCGPWMELIQHPTRVKEQYLECKDFLRLLLAYCILTWAFFFFFVQRCLRFKLFPDGFTIIILCFHRALSIQMGHGGAVG